MHKTFKSTWTVQKNFTESAFKYKLSNNELKYTKVTHSHYVCLTIKTNAIYYKPYSSTLDRICRLI